MKMAHAELLDTEGLLLFFFYNTITTFSCSHGSSVINI